MSLQGHAATDLAIVCAIRPTSTELIITYVAKNSGKDDAYLLDLTGTPHADHATFDVDVKPIYLAWLGGRTAHLAQGIAPLPLNRLVNYMNSPFAGRLAPGASLTRSVSLPLPLAEFGPYDASARDASTTIDTLVVTLAALRPSAPGFESEELADHPGVFRTRSEKLDSVERARCEVSLPATPLHLFEPGPGQLPTFRRAQ